MPHLPEISEPSAAGSLRDIYADIRQVTGLSFVNLIYRHLATRQDVLEWTWAALRPHFVSGAIATAASDLRVAVAAVVQSLAVPAPGRHSNLHPDTVVPVLSVLESYGVGNSLNLVAFTSLLRTDVQHSPIGPGVRPHGAVPADLPPLPPLRALRDLAPEIVARIHRLNACADEANPDIVASLYRHLALWPDALEKAETLLEPLQQRGVLQNARIATVDAVQVALQGTAMPMPSAPASFNDGFREVLCQFTTVTIPKMLPIGALLQAAWQAPPQAD